MTPLKAIRAKCLDCCCGQQTEVKLCPCTECPLHNFRFGKGNKREMTDQQREELRERGRKLAESNLKR